MDTECGWGSFFCFSDILEHILSHPGAPDTSPDILLARAEFGIAIGVFAASALFRNDISSGAHDKVALIMAHGYDAVLSQLTEPR